MSHMPEEGYEAFIRPELFWRHVGLRAQQTVVHLGCGAGFFLVAAAKFVGNKGHVIGIDILEDKLTEAGARAKRENVMERVRLIRGNLEKEEGSTLADRVADWVLVANILHQSEPLSILTEAKRIVRPDGTIVVVEWDTRASPFGPPDHLRLSHNDVLTLAKKVGLLVNREFSPSPYHYGFLFQVMAV